MRSKALALVVICIFLMSTPATPQAQSPNFDVKLIFPSDFQFLDSIAQTIKQQLTPLLVDINPTGSPRPVYLNELSEFNYDMAIFSMDLISEEFPSLYSQFSPDTYTGQDLYRTSDEDILTIAGIENPDNFFDKLDLYRTAETVEEKRQLAFELQTLYNDEWLLDLPLSSSALALASWSAFENFDAEEGLIKSLFLGADWSSNPAQRAEQDRTTDEIHYAIDNYQSIRNPLFYQGRDSFVSLEALYSSAFLTDKTDTIQPNLVTSFEEIEHENGSNTWVLYLRSDATWTDGEPLDAYDLKFTYDMVSFDWIGATNTADWDFLQSIDIIDDYRLNVTFSNSAITNMYTLSDQYIIPEHILNASVTVDGTQQHPYEEYNPSESNLWRNYINNPVTAGPYSYNAARSSQGVVQVFERNTDYWSPSVTDTPNQIFNLTSGETIDSYFFDGIDTTSLETLVYHISGQNIDPNTLVTAFTTGDRDLVEFRSLNSDADIFTDSRFEVSTIGREGGGLVILFNPTSELADYDVRRAITHAVNRQEIVTLLGQGYLPQLTPVSRYYDNFYNTAAEIPYDYETARDIFRQIGYDAFDAVTVEEDFEWPWDRLPLTTTPVIVAFLALAGIRLLHRRQYR